MPKQYICAPQINKEFLPTDKRVSKNQSLAIDLQRKYNTKIVIENECINLQFGSYCSTSGSGPKNSF